VAHRIELRLLSAIALSSAFSRKVFTQLGHFLQKRALSTGVGLEYFTALIGFLRAPLVHEPQSDPISRVRVHRGFPP
jgi:hypothetical protein